MKPIVPSSLSDSNPDAPCDCDACKYGFEDYCKRKKLSAHAHKTHVAFNGPDGEPLVILEPTGDGELMVSTTNGENGFVLRSQGDLELFYLAALLVLRGNKKP